MMSDPLRTPPTSKALLSPGPSLAKRLARLLGQPFKLTGKTRTDGSNLRKVVTSALAAGSLPPPAVEGAWRCVVPKKKGVPRLLLEFVDTYIVTTGSSYNLQVWNRNPSEPTPQIEYANGSHLRANDVRLILVRVDPTNAVIRTVIVMTPDYVVEHFGKFGKQTVKEQLIITNSARAEVLERQPPVLFYPDEAEVATTHARVDLSSADMHACPSAEGVLTLDRIRQLVVPALIGRRIDPGATKNRGQELERIVAEVLGYKPSERDLLAGGYPDLRHQALEVKVQDAPTVDLGRYSPQFDEPVPDCGAFTTRTTRYLISLMDASTGTCKGLILCPGAKLGAHFVYVGEQSFKCQRSIPMAFFSAFEGQAVFNPPYP